MALTKVQADGINLADTFAYTGTVTGTQGLVKISSTTVSSAAASVGVTGMSSTYDFYQCHFTLTPATDNVNVFTRFFDSSGTQINSSAYGGGLSNEAGDELINTNSANTMEIGSGVGSDTNESMSGILFVGPANSTTHQCGLFGHTAYTHNSAGNPVSTTVKYSFLKGNMQAISGLRFACSSGNIEAGTFTLYGVTK